MATDDDIKKIAKGIGAIIATAGAVGLAKVVADSSNRKKSESNNNDSNTSDSESVRQIIEEVDHVRNEINQMFDERQVQEQMDEMWAQRQIDEMWALHDAEQEEFQNTGDNSMDWNIFGRNSYRNSYDSNNYGDENDDYDEDDYDEDDYDSDEKIDNSELSYLGNNICIRLNGNEEKNYRLKNSEIALVKRFPKLKELSSENRMQHILEGMFPEGFRKHMYIRNLTFTNQSGYDIKLLGIRPERTLGDFMEDYLPDEVSLLFKGHIAGKEFIVDSVSEVMDTEQLDFEVDAVASPYRTPERIGANFLYDILDHAGSLTEYTEEKLEEWKQYLEWKRELARRQIYGCKYFKVGFDEEKKRLNFWLVFEDKDAFVAFKKYLSRDIQVFDNNYSKDEWIFDFVGDFNNRKQRFNSVEVGRYRGVVSEYYLRDNNENLEEVREDKHILTEEEWMSGEYYENE